MPSLEIAYVIAVLLLAYFVRGISGFGSGLIAVPLLALRFPLPQVVPFMLIADFTASALIGGLNFQHVDRAEILRLIPTALAGVILGTTLLVSLPASVLLTVLGLFILAFALRSLLVRPRFFSPASPYWAYPAALIGGSVGALFGTGGPPYVIYLSHRIPEKSALRATLSGLFFMDGALRIATFLIAGLLADPQIWIHAALALPIILAALFGGSHVHTRMSNLQIQRMVAWLLLASAASVLFKAWH